VRNFFKTAVVVDFFEKKCGKDFMFFWGAVGVLGLVFGGFFY